MDITILVFIYGIFVIPMLLNLAGMMLSSHKLKHLDKVGGYMMFAGVVINVLSVIFVIWKG